jgi:hypothetical protein
VHALSSVKLSADALGSRLTDRTTTTARALYVHHAQSRIRNPALPPARSPRQIVPAIIIATERSRYERAAAQAEAAGLRPIWSPAVFGNASSCLPHLVVPAKSTLNLALGHYNAWSTIAAMQTGALVMEEDALFTSTPSLLQADIARCTERDCWVMMAGYLNAFWATQCVLPTTALPQPALCVLLFLIDHHNLRQYPLPQCSVCHPDRCGKVAGVCIQLHSFGRS